MSFADLEAGSAPRGSQRRGSGGPGAIPPAARRGSNPAPEPPEPLGGDWGFAERCQGLARDIALYAQQVRELEQRGALIGTREDTHDFRAGLHRDVQTIKAMGERVTRQLGELVGPLDQLSAVRARERKAQQRKLVRDFERQGRSFQGVVENVLRREAQFVERARASFDSRSQSQSGADEEQSALLLAVADDHEVGFNEALIQEREDDIANIAQSMQQVNAAFQDLALLVDDQNAEVQEIGSAIESAHEAAQGGLGHVQQASKSQESAGKMQKILLVIVLLVAGGIGGYYALKGSGSSK